MKKSPDFEKGTVAFDFEDGGEIVVFELAKVAPDMAAKLAIHGAGQKIGDGYAGMKNEPDPIKFAREVVTGIIDRLYANDWRGSAGARIGIMQLAFAAASGKTVEEAAGIWADLDDDQRKQVAEKTKFKVALQRLKIEREAAKLKAAEEKLAKEEAAAK